MTSKERAARSRLRNLRIVSQRISGASLRDPLAVVQWMTAIQAQDFNAAKWAIGLRAAGARIADVDAAIASGKIVRSWPMRGTLHFVAAEDLSWILGLTHPRTLSSAKARRADHGITDSDLARAEKLVVKTLRGNHQLTRDEMQELFVRAKLSDNAPRGSHFLWHLSHVGVLCFGAPAGKSQTFALFDEWIPQSRKLARDEALGELTLRYFRSHGPATIRDFAWWSSLPLAAIQIGLALARSRLAELEIAETTYFLAQSTLAEEAAKNEATYALPGFDEYLLGYQDRSAQVAPEHARHIVPGANGVFRPMLVDQGEVIGTWKRDVTSDAIRVTPTLFAPRNSVTKRLRRAFEPYGRFCGLPVEITKA